MSSSPQPVADLLADLARGLRARGVRWFLFGAQAAILHGAARLTADVDVTIEPGTRSTRELVTALSGEASGCESTTPFESSGGTYGTSAPSKCDYERRNRSHKVGDDGSNSGFAGGRAPDRTVVQRAEDRDEVGLIRAALQALEKKTEDERLRREIQESVRRCADADRDENREISAAGVARRAVKG